MKNRNLLINSLIVVLILTGCIRTVEKATNTEDSNIGEPDLDKSTTPLDTSMFPLQEDDEVDAIVPIGIPEPSLQEEDAEVDTIAPIGIPEPSLQEEGDELDNTPPIGIPKS